MGVVQIGRNGVVEIDRYGRQMNGSVAGIGASEEMILTPKHVSKSHTDIITKHECWE